MIYHYINYDPTTNVGKTTKRLIVFDGKLQATTFIYKMQFMVLFFKVCLAVINRPTTLNNSQMKFIMNCQL